LDQIIIIDGMIVNLLIIGYWRCWCNYFIWKGQSFILLL